MSNTLDEMIEKYAEDGRLSCANAYKVAAKLKLSAAEVGKRTNEMDIGISACDLGQFGRQPMGIFKEDVLDDLKEIMDDKRRVFCSEARALAQKSNLKSVRTAIKEGGLDVKYCELGCFTEKKSNKIYIKTKSWIESQDGNLLFGKGKTEILELIDELGSISKAAEKLGMSYKKAWSHIQVLQKNLHETLVETKKGAGTQGGTKLTPEAYEYMAKYRQLQDEIETFANERFKELFLKDRKKKKRETKKQKTLEEKRGNNG